MTAGAASPRPRAAAAPPRASLTRRLARSPVFYGLVASSLAAVAGQWAGISPPAAYGLCSVCHGRDLADWVLNHTEHTSLFVTAAGAGWPLLTVVGVVLGSFLAARRNGELSAVDLGGHGRQFAYGAIVMCAGLLVGGCPTRILIRSGYGDVAGFVALAGVAGGVLLGTFALRWAARR